MVAPPAPNTQWTYTLDIVLRNNVNSTDSDRVKKYAKIKMAEKVTIILIPNTSHLKHFSYVQVEIEARQLITYVCSCLFHFVLGLVYTGLFVMYAFIHNQ